MAKKKQVAPAADPSAKLVEVAIKGIEEKKGNNIVCVDLRNIRQAVCDYFIICDGSSTSQVSAIAESVEDEIRKALADKPWHREGLQNSEWVLIDYVTVVVHIFQRDIRDFYNLEDLWADAPARKIETKY